jgi:hypothetical protein
MIAKALHILGGLAVSLILRGSVVDVNASGPIPVLPAFYRLVKAMRRFVAPSFFRIRRYLKLEKEAAQFYRAPTIGTFPNSPVGDFPIAIDPLAPFRSAGRHVLSHPFRARRDRYFLVY